MSGREYVSGEPLPVTEDCRLYQRSESHEPHPHPVGPRLDALTWCLCPGIAEATTQGEP
jgi:hypothetical protein